ncbi:NUDIX hydrolase [Paenibacillus soyae]|uniref:NUDIX domain-containing protein n=1 Tax=Paenibacillus soyae TaxID=2969249 RepID=A0A9X2MSG9_9BACL|nr:NUDIX domain-containing protein [Paenibacillus soyae]MCR2805555.1 NUDIX domain-containing protein [Paenibacillus soyae]
MEILREIYERDLGISDRDAGSRRHGKQVWFRRAVRGVIFDSKYRMALLHIDDGNYYKLPGGGIEGEESMEAALAREAMEEIGAPISIHSEIGLVVEYRDEHELVQFSYGYVAEVTGEMTPAQPTNEELASGLKVSWMTLREAIATMERHSPETYVGKFIQERDISFLKTLHQ